jgi:hypothetical protein
MKLENTENSKINQEFGKRKEHTKNVEVASGLKQRQNYMLKVAFEVWRQ